MMKLTTQFPENDYLSEHPLLDGRFHRLLESSASVTNHMGWSPHHIFKDDSILPGYIKHHSYGEYIFDWSWANFYQYNGLSYYPKLIHALPYTPVNALKTLGQLKNAKELYTESFELYKKMELSGEHYLFINPIEAQELTQLGFEVQKTIQFHFENKYKDFKDYLSHMSKNRRKSITKERRKVAEYGLQIELHTGEDINLALMSSFYQFYLSTIDKKSAYAYLTKEFFLSLAQQFSDKTLLITAKNKDETVAMSLFFYGENSLYGRYWGILPQYESQYPMLHFELCYYQGIEFCMDHNITLFEAGAQGEQKLFRGFKPVEILSAHHIKIDQCFEVIKKAIKEQNQHTLEQIQHLNKYLPFKN